MMVYIVVVEYFILIKISVCVLALLCTIIIEDQNIVLILDIILHLFDTPESEGPLKTLQLSRYRKPELMVPFRIGFEDAMVAFDEQF